VSLRRGGVCLAVLPAIAALVTAASGATPSAAPSITIRDRAGDTEDGNYKRYPTRGELDLRSVQVTRRSGGLEIIFQTAKPSRTNQIFSFFYYPMSDADRGGLIQVRKRSNGSIGVDANIDPSVRVLTVPSSSARFVKAKLILFVPGRYLDRLPRFRWTAAVGLIGDSLNISDQVPDQPSSVLDPPRLARFP